MGASGGSTDLAGGPEVTRELDILRHANRNDNSVRQLSRLITGTFHHRHQAHAAACQAK
jgi:hypothetical protein